MTKKIADFWKGYIKGLSDAGFSASVIIKRCREAGIDLSKSVVNSVIAEIKKTGHPAKFTTEKVKPKRSRPSRPLATVKVIKRLARQENPPTQKTMAFKAGTSASTVNRVIHDDLRLRKRFKARGHALSARHISERKTNARKLYERHLSGDKWRFVVTLDEAWIYLNDCGKTRAIFYRPKDAKGRADWIRECKESFSKGFMIIAGYCSKGRLQIRRVAKNVKVNAKYYQDNILEPLFRHEIPALYGNEACKVRIHQDKASSHTARSTVNYLQQMETETGISAIPYSDIPVKSPDASPMDFCGFGLLKRGLGDRRPRTLDGLWKACQQVWNAIPLPVLQRSLLQWKLRCRAIARLHGHHVEHSRWWKKGFQ